MSADAPLVVGIARPDRPHRVIADAEARVIEHELLRRVGRVVVDLRVDGAPIGAWRSSATTAWPAGVDAEIAASELWNERLPPLTTLFGRTLRDDAVDVRSRMLVHLGVIQREPFVLDEAMLTSLLDLQIRPTDLWAIARAAESVDVGDAGVGGLVAGTDDASGLDAAFDAIADQITTSDRRLSEIARLGAERDDLRRRLNVALDDVVRTASEADSRLAAMERENAVLTDRLRRADLVATNEPADQSAAGSTE